MKSEYKTSTEYRQYHREYYQKNRKAVLQEKIKTLYGRYFSDNELKQYKENKKGIYTPKLKGNRL